jgi:hypothetical protein
MNLIALPIYENMKLRIENELLKKGYLMKGDGTIVKYTK